MPLAPSFEFQRPTHMKSKSTSDLAVKPDQETHTACIWLEEYLTGGVDVVYFILECSLFYNITLFILN
jgi:hypothetical protein